MINFNEYAATIIAKHGNSVNSGDVLDIATRRVIEEFGPRRAFFFMVPINAFNMMNAYRAMGGHCSNW
jgi:hypothetical protein